jgi:excisionase family DNA binding protein
MSAPATQAPAAAPATTGYLDFKAAADYLGVSISTLQRHVRDGAIKPHRLGRRVSFTHKMLDRLMTGPTA